MLQSIARTLESTPSRGWVGIVGVVLFGCGSLQTPPDRSPARPSPPPESTATPTSRAETSSSDEPSNDAPPPSTSDSSEGPSEQLLAEVSERTTSRVSHARQRAAERTSTWVDRRLPTRYPLDRALSPITPHVADHLRTIAARRPDAHGDLFAKVGGSNTVNPNFMQCFADREDVELAGREHLEATIDFFAADGSDAPDPYTRDSKAAKVGWSATSVMKGDPPRLLREIRAIRPRFALVMYGTNDIGWRSLDAYAEDVFRIVDALTRRGVIPVLTSIPPRGDDPEAAEKVPRFNAVLRGIAQHRQIPFIDLNQRLQQLPNRGLGGDGLHMTALADTYFQPCVFTDEGLTHGHNTRNLLTLEMLHRLRRVVVEEDEAPDSLAQPPRAAEGTPSEPIPIRSLPYTGGRDTSKRKSSQFDRYDGCGGERDESGPEFVYRLRLEEPTRIRASVVDRAGSDLDLHLLRGDASPSNCRKRADHTVEATLRPGTHYLAVDTFVSSEEGPKPGEFVFTVREAPMQVSTRTSRE